MFLQVLLACFITSLVNTQEFEEPLQPDMIPSRDKKNPKALFESQLYGQNDTYIPESNIRGYSETDELRGNSTEELMVANQTSLQITDKIEDKGTDDAMLNKVTRSTDKEFVSRDERHGPETTEHGPSAQNVSLTSNSVIDGEETVSTKKSAISISTEWTEEIIPMESIAEGEVRGTRDFFTATSQRVTTIEGESSRTNDSSRPNGHDATGVDSQETTELCDTSAASEIPDDYNLTKVIHTAVFKLYVGAACAFAVSLLVTAVVALTLWRRRQRALTKELMLTRMSQRSQIPQIERLCSMAAFVAATDGADPSRTLTRTATVGRRPQGPRPAVTAASMPLLQNSSSSTEDLAQIRKEMFGDVRTWAPERRVSSPPTRNFFK